MVGMIDPRSRNEEKIRDLAMHNIVIRRMLDHYLYGGCSYKEALEITVITLAESNQAMYDDLVKMKRNAHVPTVIRKEDG